MNNRIKALSLRIKFFGIHVGVGLSLNCVIFRIMKQLRQKVNMLTKIAYLQLKKLITLALMTGAAYASLTLAIEAPEGVVYCHGQTVVEFGLDRSGASNDVSLTVNGKTEKLMSAFSWFGSNQVVPAGFKFAILGKGKFDPLLVFDDYLLDANQNRYVKCN